MTGVRIAMWSGPRNISTAMMRAWENREDTVVWDEPFYAHYLCHTESAHPMQAEIIAAGETDWTKVVAAILGPIPAHKTIFFQKHMTHHMLGHIDRGWMAHVANCFLIRDPVEVVASYAHKRERVTLPDIGVVQQAELFDYVAGITGENPVVVETRDILRDPRAMLTTLCNRIGVEFTPRMLHWPAGPRCSDGVWGKHWYGSVEQSTGFEPYRPRAGVLEGDLLAIAEQAATHYRHLHALRIRP